VSATRVSSGGPWEQRYGYCRAVRTGDRIVTAGCTSTVDGAVAHRGDPYAQTATAIAIGLDALAKLGAGPESVIRTRMYVVDIDAHADAVGTAHAAAFGAAPPAATMVQVARLIDPDLLVEIELEAWLGEEG
jgi:enamine deaminase RidA (YjgF/YER057c/UK114 family)